MKDIQRVWEYHGAEHKAIYAYEKGLPLTVENARTQSRLPPPLRHQLFVYCNDYQYPGVFRCQLVYGPDENGDPNPASACGCRHQL